MEVNRGGGVNKIFFGGGGVNKPNGMGVEKKPGEGG